MIEDGGIRALQHLVSLLCHELVSPVGAVNNGIELLEETELEGMEQSAVELIAQSGKQAAIRLRFYRMAYGSAGTASDFRPSQAQDALVELFGDEGRFKLIWRQNGNEAVAGVTQYLVNLVLLATSCLPRGGSAEVTLDLILGRLAVRVAGAGVRLGPGLRDALEGRLAEPDHTTVQAWFCHRLAARLPAVTVIDVKSDVIEFTTAIPINSS